MDISIDKGVPLPKKRQPTIAQYPIDKLDVKESILFPKEHRNRVQVLVTNYKKRSGKEFTVRVVDDKNCRVWRVK